MPALFLFTLLYSVSLIALSLSFFFIFIVSFHIPSLHFFLILWHTLAYTCLATRTKAVHICTCELGWSLGPAVQQR